MAENRRFSIRMPLQLAVRVAAGWVSGLALGVEQILSVDPGIELGLTVFVSSRRYRQTNSRSTPSAVGVRVLASGVGVGVGIELRSEFGLG